MQQIFKRIVSRRPFRIGAVVLIVYALLGFLLLPFLVEQYVPKYARETLQRQASIGAVRVNPFLFKVEADDFRLQEADGRPVAALRHLLVDFETSSLFRWAWTFADIRLDGLDLLIDNGPNNRLNLAELADRFSTGEAPPSDEGSGPARLLLTHIAVVDAVITYSDRTGKKTARVTLQPLNLEFNNVATLPERNGTYRLSAQLPDGGKANLQGEATLHPVTVTGKLDIQGFRSVTVWSFLGETLRLAEPQGAIDLQMSYRFSSAEGKPRFGMHDMQLHATGLDVREPGAQQALLALETLDIKDGKFDLGSRALSLPQIALRNGRVSVALATDGVLNWQRLTVPREVRAEAPPATVTKPSAPWHIQLGAVQLDTIAVHVDDHSRATPLALDVGQLGASLNADINVGTAATSVIANAVALNLSKLTLKSIGETEPLATLAQFKLDGGKLDTGSREVSINQVNLREGSTRIERDEQGTTRLFAAFSAKDAGVEQNATAVASRPAWRFKLDALQLEAFRVDYAHLGLKPALAYTLEDITATLKNLSNDAQSPVNFETALRVAQGGALSANGNFAPDGSSADVKLKLDHIAINPLRSLLAQHALLDLKTGAASAVTDLEYRLEQAGPVLRASGTASVADLLINEADGGDRFLAWKTLAADGIDFESASESKSGRLNIKAMHLVEPGAKVMIFKDRSVNLGKVFDKGSITANAATMQIQVQPKVAHADDSDTTTRPFPVTVARVRVDKGIVDYSDQSLVLPFAAQIHDFHGAISGVSSDPKSRAKVEFDGRVEKYGQAKVRGALSPFDPKRFTDIRTQFINIDMPPFSPYSATFAGRKIAQGKLSLDLEYKINDGVLAGNNKILLDKFTLGEPVDSPDTLDLPLDLAVALLTDSQGRIDIAVPVKGDMNSPTFAMGGVIGQAVTRMLTKIVTAPFSMLGKLLGGGDTQSNVIAFDPGSERLQPPQQEKLVGVGKALKQRPQLSVSVGGRYASQQDGKALRSAHVQRALAAELDVKLEAGDELGPVAFEQAQTQRALEKLLETRAGDNAVDAFQADFEKQAGKRIERVNPVLALIGKESPDHEFYAALFVHLVELQPLPDAELIALAQQRAEIVAQSLVKDAGVDARRVSVGKVERVERASGDAVETVLSLGVQKVEK